MVGVSLNMLVHVLMQLLVVSPVINCISFLAKCYYMFVYPCEYLTYVEFLIIFNKKQPRMYVTCMKKNFLIPFKIKYTGCLQNLWLHVPSVSIMSNCVEFARRSISNFSTLILMVANNQCPYLWIRPAYMLKNTFLSVSISIVWITEKRIC